MLALDVRNINKQYDRFQLKDVSFQLEKGYIMGFIGANGAGKTTTIKSILNMVHLNSGEIYILGKRFADHDTQLKQDIGYAFGGIDFYTRTRVTKLTGIIKRFYSNWDDDAYRRYLEKFRIDESKKVIELSAGMKVKYNLALALSHGAKLLILDEPTSGLDPIARDDLLSTFQELIEDGEMSILFSTHITSDLEKCADYITFIDNGRIVNSAAKEDFVCTYRLLHGDAHSLEQVKDKLISYRKTSFGFTGLIHAVDFDPDVNVQATDPNLEEIMIFHSRRAETHA